MFRAFATRQIDVLFFFPDQIGIVRNLAGFVTRSGHRMDALMGGSEWRESAQAKLAARRQLNPVEARDLARSWVSRFQDKMATIGYRHYDHAEPLFTNRKNARMYHLLFFSRHPAGLKIWRNIKREVSGPRGLEASGAPPALRPLFLLDSPVEARRASVGGARGMPAEGPALARRWANEGEGRRKPFLVLESPTPDAPRGSRNRGVESWHEEGSRHADARASHRRHPQCRRRA